MQQELVAEAVENVEPGSSDKIAALNETFDMCYMEDQLSTKLSKHLRVAACDMFMFSWKNVQEKREHWAVYTALNVEQSQGDMVSSNDKLRVQRLDI